MTGKIYGVGVGPGDPELLTLKAARILREADLIAIPGKEKETCTALAIAKKAVPEIEEKEILPVVFPMVKDKKILLESHERAARDLAEQLEKGKTAAFVTLGDPTVYSTYLYVHKRLRALGYEAEIVSGVPSFCAAAARLSVGLGEEGGSIHILPGSYPLGEGLSLSGTKILMKSGKQIGAVKQALKDREIPAMMVENCGMDGERIFETAEEIPETAGYYSLIIAGDGRMEP